MGTKRTTTAAAGTVKENVAAIAEQKQAIKKVVVAEPEVAAAETKAETKPSYRVRNKLEPTMVVTVRNGFQGKLIYISRKTGEKFEWEEFGYEQDMELQELKSARNASKLYFENNWFLLDDPEVIEYLGVAQYYKYALSYDNFDSLFEMSSEEIKERISKLSRGQRSSVVYRAKQLISEGVIDSMKVISALEEALAVELIER